MPSRRKRSAVKPTRKRSVVSEAERRRRAVEQRRRRDAQKPTATVILDTEKIHPASVETKRPSTISEAVPETAPQPWYTREWYPGEPSPLQRLSQALASGWWGS